MPSQTDADAADSTIPSDSSADRTFPTSAFDLDFRPRGKVFPSPADWRDVTVYQLLFDRFDDGRERPAFEPGQELPRGEMDFDSGKSWCGGTIRGAMRRLDYIKGLGVGAIWVNPPLRQRAGDSSSYHGYAIQNFLDVDPHLGTTQDFVDFVRAAHERGLYVIMDIVIDHTADLWSYAEGEVEWDGGRQFEIGVWHDGGSLEEGFGPDQGVWPKELQRIEAFARKGRMRDIGEAERAEAKDGDFMALKVLNLQDPQTLSTIINVFKYWIAVADVDGFRIDAMRHVRIPAASDFCHAIREYALSIGKRNFLQIGEVADESDEMARYVGSNVELAEAELDPDKDPDQTGDYPKLDAVLDFAWQATCVRAVLGHEAVTEFRERMEFLRSKYRDFGEAGKFYVTYVENHDLGAIDHRRLLNGTHEQRPDSDRPGGDTRLATMAAAVLLTSMGIPVLYYGTEQGYDGGGEEDVYVRECLFSGNWGPFGTGRADDAAGGIGKAPHFFDTSHPIYRRVARLTQVRSEQPALRYGRQYFREISTDDGKSWHLPDQPGEPFAYARVLDVTEIVVAVNPSLEERAVWVTVDGTLNPPGSSMSNLATEEAEAVTVEQEEDGPAFVRLALGPRSSVILRQDVQ